MEQLTKNQIQELFAFTKAHRIRYYDLQSEVVDHLASAIESKWADNPTMPFQKALDEVYAGFGIYGFGKLEQEKRDAIHRKIGWKVWTFLKSYLTLPKISLTLLMVLLVNQFLSQLQDPFLVSKVIIYLFMLVLLGVMQYNKFKAKKLMDKYLEVNAVYTWGFPVLLIEVLSLDFLMGSPDNSIYTLWLLSVWVVISLLTTAGVYKFLTETIAELEVRFE